MKKQTNECLQELVAYINVCIKDACEAENRDNDVEFQYMIIKKELIFGIKSKYQKVRRRVEYRLLRNLKKNFGYNFNIVYPESIKETGYSDSIFRILKSNLGVPVNHAICKWNLFGNEYYLSSNYGNRPKSELGMDHINKLHKNGYDYPNGGWDSYCDAFNKTYGMSPMDSFVTEVYPQLVRTRAAFKHYEKDLMDHGCGYWSVCSEHGYACMCSPTSKVMQGFDMDVWNSLARSDGY